MYKLSTLKKKAKENLEHNFIPKVVCLLLAIMVWLVVEYVYLKKDDDNWDTKGPHFVYPH